jgi:hypothetical protein
MWGACSRGNGMGGFEGEEKKGGLKNVAHEKRELELQIGSK